MLRHIEPGPDMILDRDGDGLRAVFARFGVTLTSTALRHLSGAFTLRKIQIATTSAEPQARMLEQHQGSHDQQEG